MNIKHIIITNILVLLMCSTASAWLSGYDHRMQIDINNTNDNLTDYQYNFIVNTATLVSTSKMRADGGDCRITNATDVLQDFWNETAFNDSSTKIWVNASLGNVTNTTHYLYYGKSDASPLMNATTTFNFYDNFGDDDVLLEFVNESINPTRTPDDAWESPWICEQSEFNYSGKYISWYRGGNEHIGYENSSDGITWTPYAGNPILSDAIYPSVVQDGDNFYMFVKKVSTGNLYLYNVTSNHTNPIIMNGGNPVYTHSSTSSDWDYTIYNPAVEIVNGTWHMLIEGKTSTSIDFQIGYAHSNLTEMDWSAHRTSSFVIDTAGNPDLVYVQERNALLALYGSDYTTGIKWVIKASCASLSDDLSLPASWVQASKSIFVIEQSNIHIADPHIMTNFNATHPIMISYCYNQAETYQQYSALTLLEFYDHIAAGYQITDKWNIIQSSGASISDGLLSLYKTNTPHTAVLTKTYQIDDGIIETRARGTLDNYGTYIWFRRALNTYSGNYPRALGQGGLHLNYAGYQHSIIIDQALKANTVISADNNWHQYRLTANDVDLTFKMFSDGSFDTEQASVGYSDTGGLTLGYIGFEPWSLGVKNEIDWVRVRKYAASVPTTSLGAEENAPAENNVVLGANKYGMLRKDVSAAQTFSTIAGGFAHDVCFTWWNSTGDNWESYWVGDYYNSAKSVPQNDSYFVLMDGTGETVSCSIAAAGTVAIPSGWSTTYLRENTSKTLNAIKSDMGGNCVDLYAWNHTASGTGAWTDTGAYSVLPNQGLLVSASSGFNWDGSVP